MPDSNNKPSGKIDLSIVLPAFNEQESINDLLLEIVNAFEKSRLKYEVIVVDDGSADKTSNKVKGFAKQRKYPIRLYRHMNNKGNGAAVKTGIRAAKGARIACIDADGQHDPQDLLKLYEYSRNYQMIVGARSGHYRGAMIRNLGNDFFNWFSRLLTGFPIEDLTSGFRVFSGPEIKRYVELLPARFSYPTTSTLVFLKAGYDIKYVPIQVRPRHKGVSKIRIFQDGWRFLIIILKIIVLFEPLQIFLPIAALFFFGALGSSVYSSITLQRLYIPNSGVLLFSLSVIVFLLGLIAEQVTNLQLLASDRKN